MNGAKTYKHRESEYPNGVRIALVDLTEALARLKALEEKVCAARNKMFAPENLYLVSGEALKEWADEIAAIRATMEGR